MKRASKIIPFSFVVIWAPVLYGWSQYTELPSRMATHWGVNNTPNGWLPKAVAIYGIPVLMTVLQLIVVGASRLSAQRKGAVSRFERMCYAIIPLMMVVLYFATIQANLGRTVDIRRVAILVVALLFMGMGNFLPTVPAGSNTTLNGMRTAAANPHTWPRVARRLGYTMVGGGVVLLASLLTPPMGSVVALVVAIVALLGVTWWGYRVSTEDN
ncbi:DUF1648 domain-containing protein [Lacticaseibacillus thailandensis]|uniref:DUF1648 domain-containing protein n=1 Tax=Lacticaseibacillus thailandensis DSM 22698 = JCM 13996 TaxID=1423810 RepID=A0A0R2CBU6_9LACO|nr:DUF1648 domain-containing protein [Lacticaseibacillus thailandensis]KRM87492.1 hypothetical protein FD19_GL000999 [Lacticaseibacillus thailandensis DSM 22698 = JCM 13996]